MESSLKRKMQNRHKRAMRVRKKLRGTEETPRLSVVKSNKHVYVQLINDEKAHTLASTSTIAQKFRTTEFNRKNKEAAKQLGLEIAELARGLNVTAILFDRGAFKYHGVVAAVADGAREGGLKF